MTGDVKSTAIITSAAYINVELAAEFGDLPPAFLPFGHKRLYEAQVELLRQKAQKIILTLPESFEIPLPDAAWFEAHDVTVLQIPDNLSLGGSISHALILSGISGRVLILHGDTLLFGLDQNTVDAVSVSRPQGGYHWGKLRNSLNYSPDSILTGWFHFSDSEELLRSITLCSGDFLSSLDIYSSKNSLRSVEASEWLDFGHLQTFYRARTKVSTARSFNSLDISSRTVFKSGDNPIKLRNEANWFSELPPHLRIFTPQFLGWETDGYRISYEFNPTLHELLIFGQLERSSWENIALECFSFLEACCVHGQDNNPFLSRNLIGELSLNKTLARVSQWAESNAKNIHKQWTLNGRPIPSIKDIIDRTDQLISGTTDISGVMHGDLCFPNVFFDFRQQIVKVIDPRGSISDEIPTIYGDLRYDLAKLNHSIEGYDQILTGRYHYTRDSEYAMSFTLATHPTSTPLREIFGSLSLEQQRITDPGIQALTIQLFLAMLPLHADRPDRQDAFLANAFRLYQLLDN